MQPRLFTLRSELFRMIARKAPLPHLLSRLGSARHARVVAANRFTALRSAPRCRVHLLGGICCWTNYWTKCHRTSNCRCLFRLTACERRARITNVL